MQRSSIIATVVAAGGVLIAGSAASVAVINAASLSPRQSEEIAVVAAAPSPDAVADVNPVVAGAPTPVAIPTIEVAELPELPDVTSTKKATTPHTSAPAEPAPARTSHNTPSQPSAQANKPKKPSKAASQAPSSAAAQISSDQARDLVLQATGGGDVKNVAQATRGQYAAWAVQILRQDGSLVTGYVDTATGIIFDWVVDQPAPAQTGNTSGSGSQDDSHHGGHSGESDDD